MSEPSGTNERNFGGHSMWAPLRRVLVCAPTAAGWEMAPERRIELGFLHELDVRKAELQHRGLRHRLLEAEIEVLDLPADASLTADAVYTHDASFMTDRGAILLSMGKANRRPEPDCHGAFFQAAGIPILGGIRAPGMVEGGDLVWLDERTLLAGRGYRTNAAGLSQLQRLLRPQGVKVVAAPLPHSAGPAACLHLMSLMSILDPHTVLVDLPWLAVETVEFLQRRGLRLLEIDPQERSTLGCNVLVLGPGRLLALEENARTNEILRRAGFNVVAFVGSEVAVNGGGGPTCLTRPLWRGDTQGR